MKRRDTLKAFTLGTLTAGLGLATNQQAMANVPKPVPIPDFKDGKSAAELSRDAKLNADKFFTNPELKTIQVLADYIIPADSKHGGATEAKVVDFIEFIVKDMPQHQTPMRGGLLWLDVQCQKRFGKTFVLAAKPQQTEMLDLIAYPQQAKPEMSQGVSFFNLMRNLTATGYFTSKIGLDCLGYVGNQPNNWNGPPAEVLKQYGLE
jgi:gluconate 2-dehydrogenase gamma chain